MQANVLFCGSFMLITVIIHAFLYATTLDWLNKVVDFGFTAINLSSVYIAYTYKDEIIALSQTLDSWGDFVYLENERNAMKENAEKIAEHFYRLYFIFMDIGCVFYCFFPLGKFLYQENIEPMDMLIYPCWTPLPIDTNWGYYITVAYQMLIMLIAMLSFGRVFAHKTICFITIGKQMKLIGFALLTIEKRVTKFMEENRDLNFRYEKRMYKLALDQEIKKCASHFQTIFRAAKDTSIIFRPMTNVSYHLGMWVLCSGGVQIASFQERQFFVVLQAFILLSVVLLNQYIYSVVTENLRSEVENFRVAIYSCPWYSMPVTCQKSIGMMLVPTTVTAPAFITSLGTETNMENFSKIVSGSYYYVTLLLAMRKN